MKYVFQDRGFQIHLIVYIAVNILLTVIDLTSSPEFLWFIWPLLGWGIGIIGHATAIYLNAPKHVRPDN